MGFTKKTWLALALAIVLVLGFSTVALAAAGDVTLTGPVTGSGAAFALAMETSGANATKTVGVTLDSATAAGTKAILTVSSGSDVVSLSSTSIATGGTFTVTAKKAGSATIKANAGGAETTLTVTVSPAGMVLSKDKVSIKSDATYNEFDVITVTDDATTKTTLTPATSGTAAGTVVFAPKAGQLTDVVTLSVTGGTNLKIEAAKPGKTILTAQLYGASGAAVGTAKEIEVIVMPKTIKIVTTPDPVASLNAPTTTPTVVTAGSFTFEVVTSTKTTSSLSLLKGNEITTKMSVDGILGLTDADASSKTTWTATAVKAGKAKITVTYAIGTATVTAESAEITVVDPTKLTSFDVTMKYGANAAVTLDGVDKDKETKALDFYGDSNAYLFKLVNLLPASSQDKADLDAGIFKNMKVTCSSKNVSIKLPNLDAATGKIPATDATPVKYNNANLVAGEAIVEFKAAGKYTVKFTMGSLSRSLVFELKNKAATTITAPTTAVNLKTGEYLKVTDLLTVDPSNAKLSLSFSMSKTSKKYAAMGTGKKGSYAKTLIKGIKTGTSTLTVKDKISGKTVTITFNVNKDYSNVNYYALAVTPDDAVNGTTATEDRSRLIREVFATATYNGRPNAYYTDPTTTGIGVKDCTLAVLRNRISALTTGSTYEDVMNFYFGGEIDANGKLKLAGTDVISVDDLATLLAQFKGTVVVFMDCKLGSTMYTTKGLSMNAAQFNNSVLNTFAKKNAQFASKTISSSQGEEGKYKFKVLSATSKKSNASGGDLSGLIDVTGLQGAGAITNFQFFNKYFTSSMINGLNPLTMTRMPADTNNDGLVTLRELYSYTYKSVKADVARYNKGKSRSERITQVVGAWPSTKDAFPVYARKTK